MASVFILKLIEEIGKAFSHALASLVAVANKRAHVLGFGDDSGWLQYWPSVLGDSHARW